MVFTVRVVDCAAITMHAPRPWVRIRSPLGVERTEHLDGDQRAPTHEGPYDFSDGDGVTAGRRRSAAPSAAR